MINYITLTDKSIKEILSNVKRQLKDRNCKSKKTVDITYEVQHKNIKRPTVYIPLEVQKLIEEIVDQAK
jgi:hypothetical protein